VWKIGCPDVTELSSSQLTALTLALLTLSTMDALRGWLAALPAQIDNASPSGGLVEQAVKPMRGGSTPAVCRYFWRKPGWVVTAEP
jgi:hypothetical protein